MKLRMCAASVLAFGVQVVFAQAASGAAQPPATPASAGGVKFAQVTSDRDNFTGDRIRFPYTTLIVEATKLGNGGGTTPVCVPARTNLLGVGKGTLNANGSVKEMSIFSLKAPAVPPVLATSSPDEVKEAQAAAATAAAQCGTVPVAAVGQAVLLDPEMLRKSPPERFGWTYGTLVVPYKYQVQGDRSLSGGATLGGYAGFRGSPFGGPSLVFMGFAGATKVDVPTTRNGQAVTESVAGLSYGVGLLGSIKDAFKVGFVIGADRVDNKLGYVNNGKTWISFSLGYDFYQ